MSWPYTYGTPQTFNIYNDCATKEKDTCHSHCVWDDKSCIPAGLFVTDKEAVFTLDTGSSIASLAPEYCNTHDITVKGVPIIRNYGSLTNVHDTPTQYPHNVLGQEMQPTCSSKHLPYTIDGLIGIAPSNNTQVRHHSIMSTIPYGQRRFKLNKEDGTVCFGCAGPEWNDQVPIKTITHSVEFIAVDSADGGTLILDTGSTSTKSIGHDLCLVGYNEIRSINVDYDNNVVSYDIDEDRVQQLCHAPQ